MPVVISPKPRSTPNPDGSNSPNPQDRIAQLEAELNSADAEIGELATANAGLQAENINLQAGIEGMASQEKTLREAHEKELKQRDDSIASLKQQHHGLVLTYEEDIKCHKRGKRIAQTCLAAVVLAVALGFGMHDLWSRLFGSPTETVTYHVGMDQITFKRYFPDYASPDHYCGENISLRGIVDHARASTPTIDCTGTGSPASNANGCKDVSQCDILVKGTYPNGPYDVVDRRRGRCYFGGNEECRISTLRKRNGKKE